MRKYQYTINDLASLLEQDFFIFALKKFEILHVDLYSFQFLVSKTLVMAQTKLQ